MKKQIRLHRRTVLAALVIYLTILAGTIRNFDAAAFPKPTMQTLSNGVWAAQLEGYLQTHLGFHNTLFQMKSRTDLLVGEKMIQGVYVTDEMLLEKLVTEDPPAAETLAAPVNRYYEKTKLPTCLVLVPSASEIYSTMLPANAVNAEQGSRIQEVYNAAENGIRCVDAYNVLSSLKDSYLYYRTDTHWTSYGAYCVYQSLIQKMGFHAVPYQRFVVSHLSTDFRGDLYARTLYSGVHPDVLDWYNNENGGRVTGVTVYYADGRIEERSTLYDASMLGGNTMYRFYLGNPCERLVIRTNVDNGKKLIVFKDDFADCMMPFLAQHYSEICVVDLTQTGERYLKMEPPEGYTQALFLCSMSGWDALWG